MKTRTLKTPNATLAGKLATKLVALLTVLALLAPAVATAATKYTINWVSETYPDSSTYGSHYSAAAYFHVNGTPLYTPETPAGSVESDGLQDTIINNDFDSMLLAAGANTFDFGVSTDTGDNSGVHVDERVALTSPVLKVPIPLFSADRNGTQYTGQTTINLQLSQVNPPLFKDIAAVNAAIAANETALDANAAKVPNLAAQQQQLANLQKDLTALADEPLDYITQADLDALLSKYTLVSPAVRAAVEQFVADLKQSVADLQAQLTLLVQQFSQLATNVANLATQGVGGGWNPEDPNNYGLTANPSAVPDIPAPDFSQTAGAFNPNSDPYKAYADAIIARMNALAAGGAVASSQRPAFVSLVRGWRQNELALQNAINTRVGVSQAETNAFLNAQNRVIAAVQQYMDQNDWFLLNPVSPVIRQFIDGVLTAEFGPLAQDIKDALNSWSDKTPTPDEALIVGTIGALGSGATIPNFDDIADYDTRPIELAALSQARALLRTYILGIGGPFGVFVQLCEAVWGKEACTSSGKTMSISDRVISGIAGTIGSVAYWAQMKAFAGMAGTGDHLIAVAGRLGTLSLADRAALEQALGPATLSSLEQLGDEAFQAVTQSALHGSNEIMTGTGTLSADAINAPYLALPDGQAAFVPGTKAISGTSTSFRYVRFYSVANGERTTGRFLTLASEVKGMTPAQIQQKLALQHLPDSVITVTLPAGEPLAAGACAANKWGSGGGFQVLWNKTITNWTAVAQYFTNARPIGVIFAG